MNELTSQQLQDAETLKKFQEFRAKQEAITEAYMKELGISQERMGNTKITPADKITLTTDNVETVRTTKTMDLQWRTVHKWMSETMWHNENKLFQKVLVEKSINGIVQEPEEEWVEVPTVK